MIEFLNFYIKKIVENEKKEEIILVRNHSHEKQPSPFVKFNDQVSITHESLESDKKIENQLAEMLQNTSDLESFKFEEEIKEEIEIDADKFFKTSSKKTHSSKTSPYSKTYNHKSKFEKVLISPINRPPMNIVNINTKSIINKNLCKKN